MAVSEYHGEREEKPWPTLDFGELRRAVASASERGDATLAG